MLSKLYKNSKAVLKNNNITTVLISVTELSQASIQTPNEQRIIIPDKIVEIVKYQEEFFKSNKHFNFVGTININCCLANEKNYLIDGQHRFHAIKRLCNKGYKNEMVKIEIMEVKTYNDVILNYNLLNKNTPLPEFVDGIDEDIPKMAFISIRNEFPNIWKTSKKPKKPYINQNDFQESIGFLTLKLNEANIFPGGIKEEDLKQLIIDKNNKLKLWPVESYEKIRQGVKWGQYKKEADKHGFYLGMYSSINQEYVYDWVSQVVEETSGIKFTKKKAPSKKKKTIPKQKRDESWKRWIGNEFGESRCYCCRVEKIKMNHFECGHVQSEATGGSLQVDNFRPVCKKCNQTMGIKHMRDYIAEHYPQNLEMFDNNVSPGSYEENVIVSTPVVTKPKAKSIWSKVAGRYF